MPEASGCQIGIPSRKGRLFYCRIVAAFRRLHFALLDELFDDFLHLFLFDAGGFGYLPRLHRLGQEIQNLLFHGVWSLSVMSIAA